MLKVGLIGAGRQGSRLLLELIQTESVMLAGIADPARHVEALAQRLRAPCYSHHQELIARGDFDAALIAAPASWHHSIAADCLRAGKHVLVEKPVCDSVARAHELVELAGQRGLVLAVGHSERFSRAFRCAKEELPSLGAMIMVHACRTARIRNERTAQNMILELGVHDWDLLAQLVGQPITKVWTEVARRSTAEYVCVRLTFTNGLQAESHLHGFDPIPDRRTIITCDHGTLTIDYCDQSVTVATGDSAIAERRTLQFGGSPLRAELEDFVTAVETRGSPMVPVTDAIEALRVALTAIKSAQTRKEEHVERHDVPPQE